MDIHELFETQRLRDLAVTWNGGKSVAISGISDDSRHVKPGDMFVAVPGAKADGVAFVPAALAAGAAALLVPRFLPEFARVPQLVSTDVRRSLALLAAWWHGDPARQLKVIGVTGTNGKTTTSFVLREILERSGLGCGLIGTVRNVVGAEVSDSCLTTPGPLALQAMLARMRDSGQRACVMEVSSHALDQRRVEGMAFAGAIFTNLTRDHLDYHGDFETYFRAKARLFEALDPAGYGVINLDDAWGRRMRGFSPAPCLGYGTDPDADARVSGMLLNVGGASFQLHWQGRRLTFRTPMTGAYNVQNLAGAITLALAMGLGLPGIRKAVSAFTGAPGRLERVPFEDPGPAVFVDYAHTPDAMENVLRTLRQVCAGRRLTCVFGCGGDRDRTKRPRMGEIASHLSDRPVVTSDNPRSEDPVAIIEEICTGIPPQRRPVETWTDRREAIEHAIAEAGSDDVVVIVGKGHETYQIFSDRTVHFDDKEEALAALARHWGAPGRSRRTAAAA
jgi:UDP-N-acetylmuramoyl-L-alanyl-D-glutamate--2,6-diaminopimelate ligase